MDGQLQVLEQKITSLITDDPSVFLVELRIKPTNNIKVFLDADNGISIERLIQYNRRLYKDLEESNMYPDGDFSLEVSSPGLDEPLKSIRQYRKNIGRHVEILQLDGARIEGKLLTAEDEAIVVEEEKGKGKKKETVQHSIPLAVIKATRVQIRF